MPQADINFLAVFGAAIIAMVIGALWFSPPFFGKTWAKLSGITQEQMKGMKKKGMEKAYFGSFVGLVVMSYVLSYFIDLVGATLFMDGLRAGFWVWLGFVAPVMLGSIWWEGKPLKLFFINAGQYLVVLGIMGGMLAVWM